MNSSLLEKATFARSWDPKVACMVTLTLVFLCGAAAGAVAMNFGLHNHLHQPSFDTAVGKEVYFDTDEARTQPVARPAGADGIHP